jgi:hypothetical protein
MHATKLVLTLFLSSFMHFHSWSNTDGINRSGKLDSVLEEIAFVMVSLYHPLIPQSPYHHQIAKVLEHQN